MKKYLFVILVAFWMPAKGQNRVVLRSAQSMNDPATTNLIESLSSGVADLVSEGKVQLWKDPNKTETLSKRELSALREKWNLGIEDCNEIYLFEIWTVFGKELKIETAGVLMVHQSASQDVNLGFIDISQNKELLRLVHLRADRWGCNGVSSIAAIEGRNFEYEIQSFEGKKLNKSQERKIEKNFFVKHIYDYPEVADCSSKKMVFRMDAGDNSLSGEVWKSIDFLLNDYPLLSLNASEDDDMEMKTSSQVSDVLVTEQWHLRNDRISSNMKAIKVILQDGREIDLSPAQLRALPMSIAGEDLYQILKKRTHEGELIMVNEEALSDEEGRAFLKEIKALNWNKT